MLFYVFIIHKILPTVKRIIIAFAFNICCIAFSLFYFLNSKFSSIHYLQLFFEKRSNNFFVIKIGDSICPWHIAFKIFNHKHFLRLVWNITVSKYFYIFIFVHGKQP